MNISSFFKLIRWKNLLMIAFIQLLFKYVYFPTFSVATTLNNLHIALLILATLSIAAAGYILNDIYDVEADKINKPTKIYITKSINKKTAFNLYYTLNVIGLTIGSYISYHIKKPEYVSIFIITALLLKLYNSDFKKLPLIGNIIISLLVSLSILIIGVFDIIPVINEENAIEQYYAFNILINYAIFAFMFMLLRELVKDIEDVNGDLKLQMKTLPILIGRKRARNVVFIIGFIPLILVTLYSFDNFYEVPFVLAYMLIVVLFPLLHFMTKILYASTKKDYTYASKLLKIIMLLGMLSIIIISINIDYVT